MYGFSGNDGVIWGASLSVKAYGAMVSCCCIMPSAQWGLGEEGEMTKAVRPTDTRVFLTQVLEPQTIRVGWERSISRGEQWRDLERRSSREEDDSGWNPSSEKKKKCGEKKGVRRKEIRGE